MIRIAEQLAISHPNLTTKISLMADECGCETIMTRNYFTFKEVVEFIKELE